MIRNLLTAGLITGFIASAFVTPTDANFQTMEAIAKNQVRDRTVGSLLGGTALSPKDAAAAAKVLSAVATNPALKSAATKAIGSASSLKNIGEAATVLTSVSVPSKTAKRVVTKIAQIVTTHRLTSRWKTYRASADPFTLAQMERIEWALKKNDVRRCADVSDAARDRSLDDPQILSPGDYLALCVAVVTGDSGYCGQILSTDASSFSSLCFDELAVP